MRNLKEFFNNRFNILILASVILFLFLVGGLINLQLIKGNYYLELANKRMYKNVPVKAPRGEIVDRYGRPLVSNKAAYSIIINDESLKNDQMNLVINNLLDMCSTQGRAYEDNLPVTTKAPYAFRFGENLTGAKSEDSWKATMKIDALATPAGVMDKLAKKYGLISDSGQKLGDYSNERIRQIIGVRYDMIQRLFNTNNPFVFENDVDMKMISIIKENATKYKSVEIMSEPIREYPLGNLGIHFLGKVGIIYAEEYESLKDKGYGMNDMVGKEGLEKYLEDYLKGQDGKNTMEYKIQGENVTIGNNLDARPGNRVVLTIDSNVQKVAEDALAEAVKNIKSAGGSQVTGGAVVAIEVNSGEVLALANYPTYDPKTFKENYNQLINDPANPIFNRSLSGTYPPGSTFKPLIAIAGLEEKVITSSELINCTGIYDYFAPDFRPACWIYNDYRGSHGPIDLEKAIEVSCNIFFYETGRRLGIDNIDKYAKQFGFGQKTEIELAEEAGVISSPEYKQGTLKQEWYPGDTIQTSIGQSYSLFTPMQLANYAATIANGGTRYKPHLVKNIVAYDGSQTIESIEPTVLNKIDISKDTLQHVVNGMERVATTGNTVRAFTDISYKVAAKTGTAQVSGGKTPNAMFIAFAPADNPQIAVVCMIEHGGINGQGHNLAFVARKIFDTYLYSSTANETYDGTNKLLP